MFESNRKKKPVQDADLNQEDQQKQLTDELENDFEKQANEIGELPPTDPDYLSKNEEPIDIDSMFESLSVKKTQELVETTANYLKLDDFKIGEEKDFIYLAKTVFARQDTGEAMQAVKLIDRDRNSWICAAQVVVENLSKIEKVPAAIRMRFNGKKKGKNGSYYDVQIFTV